MQGSGIAEVGVDARELASVFSGDAADDDVALALGAAVSAGAVELAVVFDVEAVPKLLSVHV
jgi:hypothetical protein